MNFHAACREGVTLKEKNIPMWCFSCLFNVFLLWSILALGGCGMSSALIQPR